MQRPTGQEKKEAKAAATGHAQEAKAAATGHGQALAEAFAKGNSTITMPDVDGNEVTRSLPDAAGAYPASVCIRNARLGMRWEMRRRLRSSMAAKARCV